MSIRAFIGIPMPEEYKALLERIRSRWSRRLASRVSWSRAADWHITLKFLGNIDEASVPGVSSALAAIRFAHFDLQAGGGGTFPLGRKPRVVWIGLAAGGAECGELAERVEESLLPLGFEPEARGFTPHLTLARVKIGKPDPWETLLAELDDLEWPRTRIERFVLWQSTLGPQGPTYTVLKEFFAGE